MEERLPKLSLDPLRCSSSPEVDSTRVATQIKERHFKREINDVTDKYKNILATNEQLTKENEINRYQIDFFKDEIDELIERIQILQRDLRVKNTEFDLLRRDHNETLDEVKILRAQLAERDQTIDRIKAEQRAARISNNLSLNVANLKIQTNGCNDMQIFSAPTPTMTNGTSEKHHEKHLKQHLNGLNGSSENLDLVRH